MDEDLFRDSELFLVALRSMRLNIVNWAIKRLQPTGTNFPQYTLLAQLDEMGETTMGRLADRLGTTMGAATNLVDRLVRSGHVDRQRSTADRRVVNVKCTDKGRQLIEEVTTDTARYLGGFFGRFPPEDRKTVIRVCRKLVELMDAHAGS